ncbi:MAG: aminotransferase class V-fold PLP-dependent enzyme [Planctomycetaceae bacterium]|jgi:cysteine desulfurase|nr:aminotransferase class V-fold PLP-dependent enzyme [Planctomycetaceae bacterium]
MIYLDSNATTAIAPEVLETMLPFFTTRYYNPSSAYSAATGVAQEIRKARKTIADFLGMASPKELIFTSCATESNNHVFAGVTKSIPQRKHIITTTVEHPAVLEVCRDLERFGYDVTWLPVDRYGNLRIKDYVQALRNDTLLVSIMHANNETGVIFPIEQLSRIAKETNPEILFHTDATQSMTKLPIDLSDNFRYVDFLSFSGHKFHAPKGVGGLYIRRGIPCRTFLTGGHQESGRRGGTENVPFIIGMAKAIELAEKTHDEDFARMESLRDKLQNGILQRISYLEINGGGAPRMPNTLNVACHCVEGEGILFQLNESGICASSGSACTSGALEPSHVLTAMNVPFTALHGSVRFSLSRYNIEEEIDQVLDRFPKIVERLRAISSGWDQSKNQPRAQDRI